MLADFKEPFPPKTTRQSSFNFLYVFFIASTLSKPSSITRIFLKGQREEPKIVPPTFKISSKSLKDIFLYFSYINP